MHRRQWYSNFGPLARELEARLLDIFGGQDEICVTTCNATAGLSACLIATERPGPVLVPAFTFPASLGAVRAAGMTPIVVDVEKDSWALGRDRLEQALVETGATIVMLVAPFGLRYDFGAEIELCRRLGAAVVIDNAAGLGVPRSTIGFAEDVFEVFSMHATKPFGVGEGGAIFAHRSRDRALRAAINFALTSTSEPDGPRWGFNGKMSELHAAVGLAQADRYAGFIRERQAFVAKYIGRLSKFDGLTFPRQPHAAPWQVFPVLLPIASAVERFIEQAASEGVEIRRYYRPSLSLWPETTAWGACPTAEALADHMCVLPVRSRASGVEADDLINLVCETLMRAL